MSKYEALLSLAEFILPASFLEYFDVIDVKSEKESLHIYLDEQKVLPDDYEGTEKVSVLDGY